MKNSKWNIEKLKKDIQNKKILGIGLDSFLIKALFALLLFISIIILLPSERPFEYGNLTIGSVSPEEIIAPFTFPIIKSEEALAREREIAALQIPPVFNRLNNVESVQKIKLKNLFDEISVFFQHLPGDEVDSLLATPKTVSRLDSLKKQLQIKYGIVLSNEDLIRFKSLQDKKQIDDFFNRITTAFEQVYSKGIINIKKEQIPENRLAILQSGMEEILSVDEVLDILQAKALLTNKVGKMYQPEQAQYILFSKIREAFVQPNLQYNEELTRERKEKVIREVPTSSGFVYKNQRIVDSHEIITEEVYHKLQSLAVALKEKSATKRGLDNALFYFGKYLFALLIVFTLGFFIYYYKPRLFFDNKMLALVTVILILQFLLSYLVLNVLNWNYLSAPITLGPMLFAMLLDGMLGFWGTITIALVLGASLSNNFHMALMVIFVGTIALFSVQKIRNRGQMFKAILLILGAYFLLSISYGLIHYDSFTNIMKSFLFYMVPNAILTPTIAFLLIGIFERFFDVTTDVTLLELSDLTHPLLKRLSVEAPGTFHHSIMVGNLAEAAAKAIGANSLLARVGCYYHDIGKMLKSEYFVENQAGNENKHENLTPTMSCLILVKHVKGGLEMAEEYRLPSAVKRFIPEHHGTSLMAYFYHKAKEAAGDKDVNENEFRYPGPKPQSKETAIAMLADSIEAAARSLPNPTPQKIRALVEDLVEKRFREGELNECDLTFQDLNKIKEAFIPILLGMHHLRVEYPSDGGEKNKKQEPREAAVPETAAHNPDKKVNNSELNGGKGDVPPQNKD